MICRDCGLEKPSNEFNEGDDRCHACKTPERRRNRRDPSYEITDLRRDAPAPVSVYLKPEAIYHARCEQPLRLIGYVASAGELHFRCQRCGESVFLPEVAIERVERR